MVAVVLLTSGCLPDWAKKTRTSSSATLATADGSSVEPPLGMFVDLPAHIVKGESIPIEFRCSDRFLAQVRELLDKGVVYSHTSGKDVKIVSRSLVCEIQVNAGDRAYYRSKMSVTPETLSVLRSIRETATIWDSGEPPPMSGTSLWVRSTVTFFCETAEGEAVSEVLLSKGKAVRIIEQKPDPVAEEVIADPMTLAGFVQALKSLHLFSLRIGFVVGAGLVFVLAILLKLLGMVRGIGSPGVAIQSENGTTFITAGAIRDLTRAEFRDFPSFELLKFRLARKRGSAWVDLHVAFDVAAGSFPEQSSLLRERLLFALREKLGISCPTEIDIRLRKGDVETSSDPDFQ
jgi:hypothetical protein